MYNPGVQYLSAAVHTEHASCAVLITNVEVRDTPEMPTASCESSMERAGMSGATAVAPTPTGGKTAVAISTRTEGIQRNGG